MSGLASSPAAGRLTQGAVLLYALPNLPHSFALLPTINYVPAFYSDELGLPLALVGLMLVLSRLPDIVIDPFIGSWSDRTRSRFGRRKPFIALGVPVLMLAAWMLFVPPAGAGLFYLFIGLLLMYLGFAIVDIPYAAWGAELSEDYDERSRVAGTRAAAGTLGSLVTLTIPVILQVLGVTETAVVLFWMALFFIVTQPLFFAVTLYLLPEPMRRILDGPKLSWRERARIVIGNRSFRRLALAVLLLVSGLGIGATLNKIFIEHVIGSRDGFAIMIFLENIAGLAALPLWLLLAKRIGKHRALALASLWTVSIFALQFTLGPGDATAFIAMTTLRGAALGALISLGGAMVADIADEDQLASGEERPALYFAVLGIATKGSIVLSVLLGTLLPGLAGFQPSDPVHAPEAIAALKLVYCFTPLLLAAPAIWLLWNYPLTREVQAANRLKLDQLRAQRATT
jgi:Na+/melibiose symporter-like transporter